MTSDDNRWSEASALLERIPDEAAERRLRRWRVKRLLLMAVGLVTGVAAAGFVFVLVDGGSSSATGAPAWQVGAGYTLSTVAFALSFVAIRFQWRANTRARAWRSPVAVLTREQRKELLQGVRGTATVEPARVPLARHLAENLGNLRYAYLGQACLLAGWTGLAIADPVPWRLVFVGVLAVPTAIGWPLMERDRRRAGRFLDAHPVEGRHPAG